jgi:hypothetical protein
LTPGWRTTGARAQRSSSPAPENANGLAVTTPDKTDGFELIHPTFYFPDLEAHVRKVEEYAALIDGERLTTEPCARSHPRPTPRNA